MSSAHEPAAPHAATFDLDAIIERVARWLPDLRPIKDFVHENPLHAFQHLPFDAATSAAARLYGTRVALPLADYRAVYRAGSISEAAFERALAEAFAEPEARAHARTRLVHGQLADPVFPGAAQSGLRAGWTAHLGGVPLERRSQLHVFRLLGAYLDQGLASWRMPGAGSETLYAAVAQLAQASTVPLGPLGATTARDLLRLPAREALAAALARTVAREDLYERYLLETLLCLPGWAGFAARCERQPEGLLARRRIHVLDLAAVILLVELGCLERELGKDVAPLAAPRGASTPSPDAVPARTAEEQLASVWHNALEWSYYMPLVGALAAPHPAPAPAQMPSAWAVFCLDDRSCSLRRHLEEVAVDIATFGVAGYFGLDFFYRGAGDAIASKHCPAPVAPRHLVVESYADGAHEAGGDPPWWRGSSYFDERSHTLVRGGLLTYARGLGAALRMVASVLRPSLAPVVAPRLTTVSAEAHFALVRDGDARSAEGLWLGYSVDELADRLHGVLSAMGVADGPWPELVVLFGHGASSVNNPYFAAYDCGACSGRAGAPNARAFAKAANRADVRAALRARGIDVPEATWFIGALYDTTRDEATYYDLARLPGRAGVSFATFRARMEEAAARNAAERCRRFADVPLGIQPAVALDAVRRRSIALFQPRPEYNHATNACCIVGRRALTAGVFLDRRAFLTSYDPTKDPLGEQLATTLAAVIPVCAGINLEYLFSRIDPERYGAGSKLPHNVHGLLGVCNGIEGDLRTGLPTQMTEIHAPVRLLVIVEHTAEAALAAARRDPAVLAWIDRGWVRYACVEPESRRPWLYEKGAMQPFPVDARGVACHASSLAAARAGRGDLPVSFIAPAEART